MGLTAVSLPSVSSRKTATLLFCLLQKSEPQLQLQNIEH